MQASDNDDLPRHLAAAWGLRARPAKGPKPGLSLERIVEAGIAVARAEGLTAVSMSRVASEVGASTMSLYRYVDSKDDLLALMVDTAYGPPPPAPEGEDWRAGLSRWAWTCLAVLREHQWTLWVPISGPPIAPNQLAWFEDGLRSLRATGLPEDEKAGVILLLSGYVRNAASLEATLEAGFEAAGGTPDEAMVAWSGLLERLTDDERFPALRAVLASGVWDRADHPDQEFVFGLERILDGIGVLVQARG